MPYDGDQTPIQAIVITQAETDSQTTPVQMALFKENGDAFVPLTTANVAATQATFVGADLTALKVELNAFLVKLKTAGLVASS